MMKEIGNWLEVHSYRNNFLKNPYFRITAIHGVSFIMVVLPQIMQSILQILQLFVVDRHIVLPQLPS